MVLPSKPPLGKNKYVTEIVQATPSEFGVVLPLAEQIQFPDKTTRITLAWEVNSDEWLQVFSTLMYGLDNAYPNRAIDTMQIFLRMLTTMSPFCNEVANCITDNTSVQDAITNYLLESGIINNNSVDPDNTTIDDRMSEATQDSDIAPNPAGCDNDVLWAGIREMVTRLDDTARNILEQANVINDVYQRYSNIIDAIPIIGDLAADVANNFTEVIPDVLNSFNAYSSVANMDDLACELFELVCMDCKYPTFEQVANTIATHSFGSLVSWETMSLATVVSQFIQTGQYTPSLVWHSMLLFELFTLYVGGKFGGASGSKTLTQWALLGEDVPSNDWETLCNGCQQTLDAYIVDFTQGLDGWLLLAGTQTGNGIESENISGEQVQVLLSPGTAWTPQGVRMTYERSSDGSFNDDTRVIQWSNYQTGTGRFDVFDVNEPVHTYESRDLCYDTQNFQPRLQFGIYLRDNNPGSSMILKSVTMYPPPPTKTANAIWVAC